jgi:hypothetical protein
VQPTTTDRTETDVARGRPEGTVDPEDPFPGSMEDAEDALQDIAGKIRDPEE